MEVNIILMEIVASCMASNVYVVLLQLQCLIVLICFKVKCDFSVQKQTARRS
jgi:hypothetical protein